MMRYVFQSILGTPLQADMYLAGNSFNGDIQTCRSHVWRRGESLAVAHGIDSPEQTYSAEHLEIYRRAKHAAARITEAAGGPLTSICQVGYALRAVPGLEVSAEQEIDCLTTEMGRLIAAYRYGEVSDEETRKYADSLENALPYMFGFVRHPGMSGHTNEIELLIKRRVVLPRKMQGGLPDWTAARTQANLQTIHANAAIWGIPSGRLVSGSRGSWQRPPAKDAAVFSPPPPLQRTRAAPGRAAPAADPAIQASPPLPPPRGRHVKAAAA